MANSIVINLQVNMKGAANVDALNKALQSLRRTVGSMGGNFGANNLAGATKGAQNTAKAYTEMGNAAVRSGSRTTTALSGLSREQQRFNRLLDRNLAQRREEERAMRTLAGRMRLIQPAYDAIFRAGYRLQEVGRDMMQVGMRGLDFIRDLAQEFGQFEFTINRAAGAMGLLFSEVDQGVNIYERFKSEILDTSRELGLFKAEEVAKATYFWASATGQQVDSLSDLQSVLKSVNPLMKVAAMTQTDYETAIKGVYSIITQYGKGLGDTEAVTQKLFQVTQMTAAEFPDLINSFKMVGPVAAANSVTFEDVANVLGRLADAGIRGSMAGRGLRQFFIQTVRPSKIAKAALDDLWESTPAFQGKTFEEMIFPGGQFVGIDKYVNELATALQNATEAERNFLLGRITTANELPILTALVTKQIGVLRGVSEGWDARKEDSTNAAKYFTDAWNALAESWLGVVGKLERGIESLRIIVGGRVANLLTPLVKQITQVVDAIIGWAENPANRDVIDFFIRVGAAISALLATGGGIMLFAGSMINLGAAFELVVKVFGQTIPKVLMIGAVFGTLAAAVVRNSDYIIEAGREIVENLRAAFSGTDNAIGDATNAFETFGQTVAPILDMVVRGIVDVIRIMSQLIRTVMEFGPMRQIIQSAITMFGILFGARMLAGILGITKALGLFRAIIMPVVLSVGMIGPRSVAAAAGMSTMARATGALSGAMGKLRAAAGGWIGLIAIGVLTAYESIPPFHNAVDELLDLFIDKAPEAKAAMEELIASFEQGPQMQQWLESTPMFDMLEKNIKTAQDAFNRSHDGFFENPFEKIWSKEALEDAKAATSNYVKTFISDTQKIVDSYTAGGTPISLDRFYAKMFEFRRGGATPEQARKLAQDFFNVVAEEMKAADSRAQKIISQFRMPTPSLGGWSPQQLGGYKERLIAQLISMKDQVSPVVAQQIQELLDESSNAGFVAGAEELIANAGEVAPKMWSGVAQSLISGAKELRGIDKRITEILEKALNPERTGRVLAQSLGKWVKQGFKNEKGRFVPEAVMEMQGALQDFTSQIELYSQTMEPADFQELVTKTINRFKGQAKANWSKMPPALQQTLLDTMETLYGYLGQEEIPQSVLDEIYGKGKKAGAEVPAGAKQGAKDGTPALTTQFSTTVSKATEAFRFGKRPYNEGKSASKGMASGIRDYSSTVVTEADGVKKKTNKALNPGGTPKKHGEKQIGDYAQGMKNKKSALSGVVSTAQGIIKNLNKYSGSSYNWGYHLVQNIASGIRRAQSLVSGAVNFIAGIIRSVLGHSVPQEGPLSDDDEWGAHFVDNLTVAMRKRIPALRREALSVAQAMTLRDWASDRFGVTFENSSQRVVKVQVEVTSPDGSVDRVKASQLEAALSTNDLILAIEHMSTVG